MRTNEHITPYVIEPAWADRSALNCSLLDAYDEEPDKIRTRDWCCASTRKSPTSRWQR